MDQHNFIIYFIGYCWTNWTTGCCLPCGAVEGGCDIDGAPLYVGRGCYNGDLIPAKVIPCKNVAYICYEGKEVSLQCCEVLCEQTFSCCADPCQQTFRWDHASYGHVPCGAMPVGRTRCGEVLYAARVNICGSLCIGKLQPGHGYCYVPFDGQVKAYSSYEVLVLNN